MSELTCTQRIGKELKSEIETLKALWETYKADPEANHPDYGNFNEHGLSFDYVAPNTFKGQRRGYFRYQISWGGPSDEFRFYAEGRSYRWTIDRIEYVFMDWYDGAKRTLTGENLALLTEIFQDFADCGTCEAVYTDAIDESPEL